MKIGDINDSNKHEEQADQAAVALAEEMIAFIAEQYHEADKALKLELALQYGSTIRQLQKVGRSARRNRARWHRYPGDIERKSA